MGGVADQGFLNAFYKDRIERLPFIYNAMVSEKTGTHREVWRQQEAEMVLLHYTCKPWHAWNCWWDGPLPCLVYLAIIAINCEFDP